MKTFPQARRGAFAVTLLCVSLVLAASKTLAGAAPVAFGTVTGRVVDLQSTLPISGASLTIANIVSSTAVVDQGAFVLHNVPVGNQRLLIDAPGWQRYTMKVTVTKDRTTDIGVIGLVSSLLPR